jgi:protein-tyrosine phosphatase
MDRPRRTSLEKATNPGSESQRATISGKAEGVTITPNLTIRKAGVKDLTKILDILTDAARWRAKAGEFNPWPVPFPESRVSPWLSEGRVYLAELPDEGAVGTFTLLWEDPTFWGPQPPTAGYLHRVAVLRRCAGRGVGAQMLAWAADQVTAAGRRLLRLDTLASNPKLCRYYELQGFRRVGDVTLEGHLYALFERTVTTSDV